MRRALVALAVAAYALTLVYAFALAPAWEPEHGDQEDYLALARGLAARAEYTVASDEGPFRPEPRKPPGYPLLIAPLCRLTGCDHWHVALLQATLSSLMVPLTYLYARRVCGGRLALITSASVALYPTFAYFAALALSDLPATTILVLALALAVQARERGSSAFALGAGTALGALALTRSLLSPLLVPVAVFLGTTRTARLRLPVALALGTALMIAPYAGYTYAHFGALSGSGGEGLWYGYFEGRAALPDPDPSVCVAAEAGDALPTVHAVPGLDAFETELAHRGQCRRAAAFRRLASGGPPSLWPALDRSLFDDALRLIAHDPLGWAARGLSIRSLALWARDEPLPVRAARELPVQARIGLMVVELLLLAIASIGLLSAARSGGPVGALTVSVVGYVWLAGVIFWTEGRYALPARPLFLLGVVLGARALALDARRRSVASGA